MIRLTGGALKGQSISSPRSKDVRPTLSKPRQAIFDVLGATIKLNGSHVLDLFAGSGILGFESLSRGAAGVLFVDRSKPLLKNIESASKKLKVQNQVTTLQGRVPTVLKKISEKNSFDLIFADPPYNRDLNWVQEFNWKNLLKPSGVLVLETSSRAELSPLPEQLVNLKQKTYGDTRLDFLALSS